MVLNDVGIHKQLRFGISLDNFGSDRMQNI